MSKKNTVIAAHPAEDRIIVCKLKILRALFKKFVAILAQQFFESGFAKYIMVLTQCKSSPLQLLQYYCNQTSIRCG